MERQHQSKTKNVIASSNREKAIAPPYTQNSLARSSTHPIEELQGVIGNRAVNKLLASQPIVQAKSLFRGLSHELLAPTPVQFKCISAELSSDLMQINEPIQAKEADGASVSQVQTENKTGLPDNLKEGIENLSGMAMDDVKVHYNSSKPSQIQALAHTQGTDIHVASGQEKHLPHEAWHVVQQMQGRVRPTLQAKGVSINDDDGLEHEADVMGAKALQMRQPDRVPTDSADRAAMAVQPEEVPRAAAESSHATYGDKGFLPSLSTSSVVQRMPLDEFNRRVRERFPNTYEQFYAFFQQDYIKTEEEGGFLEGGIMYDRKWEKYVTDDVTPDLLENSLKDFQSRQQEQAKINRISRQQLLIPSYMNSRLCRLGSQDFLPEGDADLLCEKTIKFMSRVHEQSPTFAQAQLYLKSQLNERTIQVVLNSVSDSVRQKRWSQLTNIADIHGQVVPATRLSMMADRDSPRDKDRKELILPVGDSPELGVEWKRNRSGWFGYTINNETTYQASKLEEICQPGVAHSELWWANREVKLPDYIAQELSPEYTDSKYVYHITDRKWLTSIGGGFRSTAARNAGKKVAEKTGSTQVSWQKKQKKQIKAKIVFLLKELLLKDGQETIRFGYFQQAINYIKDTPMDDKSPHAISVFEEMEGVDEDRDRDLIDANDKQEFQAYKAHVSGELQALHHWYQLKQSYLQSLQPTPTGKSLFVLCKSQKWQDAAQIICELENHYLTRLAKNYKMAKNAIEEMVTSQHVYVFKIEGASEAFNKYGELQEDPVVIRIPIKAFEFLSKDTQEAVGFRSRNEISGEDIKYFDPPVEIAPNDSSALTQPKKKHILLQDKWNHKSNGWKNLDSWKSLPQ